MKDFLNLKTLIKNFNQNITLYNILEINCQCLLAVAITLSTQATLKKTR